MRTPVAELGGGPGGAPGLGRPAAGEVEPGRGHLGADRVDPGRMLSRELLCFLEPFGDCRVTRVDPQPRLHHDEQPPQVQVRIVAIPAGRPGLCGNGRRLTEAAGQIPTERADKHHLVGQAVQLCRGAGRQGRGSSSVQHCPVADPEPMQPAHELRPTDGDGVAGSIGDLDRGSDLTAAEPVKPGDAGDHPDKHLVGRGEVEPPGPLGLVEPEQSQGQQRRPVLKHPARLAHDLTGRGPLRGLQAPVLSAFRYATRPQSPEPSLEGLGCQHVQPAEGGCWHRTAQ
jgi:hypothetical protein